jgi:hypothetical protein
VPLSPHFHSLSRRSTALCSCIKFMSKDTLRRRPDRRRRRARVLPRLHRTEGPLLRLGDLAPLLTARATRARGEMGPVDDAGPSHSRPARPFSSSFPPHHSSYQPVPRSDSPSQRSPYSERQKRSYDDDRDPEGEVGYAVDGPEQFGASSSGGMGWAASFAGLRRGRGGRGKVLLGLAGLALVYLMCVRLSSSSTMSGDGPLI